MPAGVIYVDVQAMSSRQKSGRITSKGHPAWNARMQLRFCKAMLLPTKNRSSPMPIWCIYMSELSLTENIVSIQWYLLTIREIISAAEVKQMVDCYVLRWQVEDTFRVLKTGCQVEKLCMKKDASLHREVTLNMVVVWRIMLMFLTYMAGLPPTSHPYRRF